MSSYKPFQVPFVGLIEIPTYVIYEKQIQVSLNYIYKANTLYLKKYRKTNTNINLNDFKMFVTLFCCY